MKPKSRRSRSTRSTRVNPADRRRLAFYVSRARMGGIARSKLHSPLWKTLCMRFLNERQHGRTEIATYKEWLVARGFGDLK